MTSGNIPHGVFVTGTDTGVGKTFVAAALLRSLCGAGRRAVGMKPVAAGIESGSEVNADVAALAQAGNVDAPLADRNPHAFAAPIAPHLAARAQGATIDIGVIESAYRRLAAVADVVVVEGAGGVLVPLDERRDMLDIASALGLPVLLVVGMRLGCVNHALLSAWAIRARGLTLAGWVANSPSPGMAALGANIDAITQRLGVAPIATFGFEQPGRFVPEVLGSLEMY